MQLRVLGRDEIDESLDALVELLSDAVDSGASVGYLPPLAREAAVEFWRVAAAEVAAGTRIVIAAHGPGGDIAGVVHLALATKPNALHRAEVQKLLVHRTYRGRGIGRRLMAAVEREALARQRTLLVLDTVKGDVAEGLYERIGYVRAGEIPDYAMGASGQMHSTIVFYKQLRPTS